VVSWSTAHHRPPAADRRSPGRDRPARVLRALGEVAGEAALLVDPHNARELADRMIEVFESESLRASLKAKGFARVKEYTWAHSALQTYDLYTSLVR